MSNLCYATDSNLEIDVKVEFLFKFEVSLFKKKIGKPADIIHEESLFWVCANQCVELCIPILIMDQFNFI